MCTAVVGGSIHRAARRISAASDQRSTTPMTSHRIKDRTKGFPRRVLMRVCSVAVTFPNNNLNRVITGNGEIAGDKRTAGGYIFSTRSGSRGKAYARRRWRSSFFDRKSLLVAFALNYDGRLWRRIDGCCVEGFSCFRTCVDSDFSRTCRAVRKNQLQSDSLAVWQPHQAARLLPDVRKIRGSLGGGERLRAREGSISPVHERGTRGDQTRAGAK